MKSLFKLIYFTLILFSNTFSVDSSAIRLDENDFDDNYLLSTIQIILLINPFNKVSVLPFSLGSIERQIYPKHRIKIFIRTEVITREDVTNDEIDEELGHRLVEMNGQTIEMLRKWIRDNRNKYNDIELVLGRDSVRDFAEDKYWTTNRFKHLIEMKTFGFDISRQNWAQFVLFIDSDVILTNDKVFLSMTRNEDIIAISPMLYSLGTYSNFWTGMTQKGYYNRTEHYLPTLERQRVGEFVVPMIHSCLFVNIRHKKSFNLTFDSRNIVEELTPFDDIIALAKSAKINEIDLYVNNKEVWGYIPPPIETINAFKSLDQDIIDLELESLVEGPEFPISSSLFAYVNRQKNSLNVEDIYVINLIRRPERLKRMLKCLEILGIKAKIWKAIDGKVLNEEYIQSKGIQVLDGYLDPYHKRPITFGEIGCFLSHYTIWEDIIARDLSEAIVLEDDVRFERNFMSRLNKTISMFDSKKYDFLYLGRKIQDSKNESLINGLFVEPTYSYWTIGYLITRRGVQKLIDSKPLGKLIPVDEFLPVMYDQHPDHRLRQYFKNRNLKALSVSPLLIYPTHYVGDHQYISDTEDSKQSQSTEDTNKLKTESEHKYIHPKHSEF